jgi:hypothetical protein
MLFYSYFRTLVGKTVRKKSAVDHRAPLSRSRGNACRSRWS